MLEVSKLRCNYLKNPIGIGAETPFFSWILLSNGKNVMQQAYQLQVAPAKLSVAKKSENDCFEACIWDSGKISSDESVHVTYAGAALGSRTRYIYRVRVWDNQNNQSNWSNTASFETGIFDEAEWHASFIAAKGTTDDEASNSDQSKAASFCKKFGIHMAITSARLYATALGIYEIKLNGLPIGEALLTPGWTSYKNRLQYQVYDVTTLIRQDENEITAMVGCGWFSGNLAWEKYRNFFGDTPALLTQLHLQYIDGTEDWVITDESWHWTESPILMSEIYHGETYDARMEQCKDITSMWRPVQLVAWDKKTLVAQQNEPVRAIEEICPISMIRTPKGELVMDFGQNMVGHVRFKVTGSPGSRVVLKHAEVLDNEGNFYTENLRFARQTITYILKGEKEECYQPHFTFQGFRYVMIEEHPGNPKLDDFAGIVIHTAMEHTGDFSCSNQLINQLQHNILWGLKGNFVDVPTDCPQRDERLGWTGDAQVFCATASYLMNTASFFSKWLRDLAADQLENGGVPFVIPHILKDTDHSSCGWGDAAVIIPWTMYVCYGDRQLLAKQYESMKAWVEYIRQRAEGGLIWNTGFHIGDWLALDAKEGSYFGATSNDLIATAYYAYSTELLAKSARVLAYSKDASAYEKLHQEIVGAYQAEFFTPAGRLAVPTQTAHVLSLMFGLVPKKDLLRTVNELVKLIENNKDHLSTGFLGTPYLCHVLSNHGRLDVAYKLLLQTDYPSWLYQVTKGATTIWEHWDGLKPDGTFWSKDMNSFNHYAFGAIGEWLYKVVAGINPDEVNPGYKKIVLKPSPGGGLTHAEASLETLYGKLSVAWKISEDGKLQLNLEIPHNTTAELHLPESEDVISLGSGKYEMVK